MRNNGHHDSCENNDPPDCETLIIFQNGMRASWCPCVPSSSRPIFYLEAIGEGSGRKEWDAIRVREPRRSCIVISCHQNGDLPTRFQGRIAEAGRGRKNEYASAFRRTFCYQEIPINIEDEMRKIDGKTGQKRKWMTLKRKRNNAMKMRYGTTRSVSS